MKNERILLLLAASVLPFATPALAAERAAAKATQAGPASAPVLEKLDGFTHGPMLGNVSATSIRVWARTRQPASFRVLYSEKPDLSGGTLSAPVTTDWSHDATGWAELTGLKPGTRYHYALVLDGKVADTRVDGEINSFRTLPVAADVTDPVLNPKGLFNFAFEIGTGNAQHGRPDLPPTYQLMRRNLRGKIDFQIQNGDWVYEEGRDTTERQWADANKVGRVPRDVTLAKGITGVWENYKIYLDGSEALRDFYREVPLLVTLDDHEILNDAIGSGEIGFRTDARGKPFQHDIRARTDRDSDVERAVFRDPASAAWYDYVGWANPDPDRRPPIRFGEAAVEAGSDVLTDPTADFTKLDLSKVSNLHIQWGFGNSGVYKIEKVLGRNRLQVSPPFTVSEKANYSIGTNGYTRLRVSNSDIFILDTRSNRTLHQNSGEGGPKTMLGEEQKRWLAEELRKSDADFVFIVSSVNLAIPHDNGVWYGQGLASATKDDGWTAQLSERAELLSLVESLGKPVFFLTGDLHKSFVARIAPGVYDVGTGPHTSSNHRLGDAGGSPPSGWFQSGDRLINLLWTSTQYRNDSEKKRGPGRDWPVYTVVKVNNAYNVPTNDGKARWIAHPEPQVIFEFHDGYSGELLFAHSVSTSEAKAKPEPVSSERVRQLGGIDAK